jgi:hypothetical protein
MEAEPPFERRVIQRLARGVMAACKAVDTSDIQSVVEGVSTGFGANPWEKFTKLIKDTSLGGLTMSFSFSPELKHEPGDCGEHGIRFGQAAYRSESERRQGHT